MESVKSRLFQVLQRHSGEPFAVAAVEVLARDALAEIEQLERGKGTYVCGFEGCRETMDPPRCPVHDVD